ncbi:tetratricopeptide repeat protein [Leptolyngbya iicbica LK]|uniref:Tetratricopeptide repeat protein n=2 Tax=Cyanophyceae TaxID=3028117 RepID=A0A4Q7EDC2_9CYAN|nr:tetratricopeptide repeat protein [Leptolyngbya sp. LK]RZM81754.1 tetratricopeptide repeat protein [Leptolyngbya sp. LK]
MVSEYYCFGHPNYGQHRFKLIRPFSEYWEDLRDIERNSGIEELRDDACNALRRGAYDLTGIDEYAQLAFNLRSQNRIAEGIEVLQHAVELYPTEPILYNNLGLLLRISQDFEGAISTYRQGIARALDFELKALLYTGLGNAFDDAGRTEEAFDAYRQAIVLDPKLAIVHYDFAIALWRAGRIDEAVEECKEALQLDSNLTAAQELLADLEAMQIPDSM